MIIARFPARNMISEIRFGFSLVSALTNPLSMEEARELMKSREEDQAEKFLALCDSEIFGKDNSPYKRLFESAGYSRERLSHLVHSEGLERALSTLAADGVYLDIKEFKGQKPVVRPGLKMFFDASLTDISSGPSIPLLSSGSNGPRMTTHIGVKGLRFLSSYIPLLLEGLDALSLPIVLYYPMPSVSGVVHLIIFAMAGFPPSAWFSQVPFPARHRTRPLFQLMALLATSKLRGLRLPFPAIAEISHPASLAGWLSRKCPNGAVVPTFPGSALHLLRAAHSEGIKLPRLIFILGGEPLTQRKFDFIRESGHHVYAWYSSVETGRIALGCFRGTSPDDMHVLTDRVVAITRPYRASHSELPSNAILLTSVHPDSYKFLLNVETGDEAVLEERRCGCLWEQYGLTRHISTVRSYEKLTLEGMTYAAGDIFRLVEETLPAQCGGTASDYQLREEESADGLTRLVVSVNPGLSIYEDEVKATIYASLREASANHASMTDILKQASAVVVRREFPKLTCSGKIIPIRPPEKEENYG
jgi:hypothetical protein